MVHSVAGEYTRALMTPVVLFLQGAAVAASLLGYLLLVRTGLFGTSHSVTVLEGLVLLSIAALYGWWPAATAAAASGMRGAMLALVILAALWALLAQGVAGFVFCAIPCPSAAPFSDLARLSSLVFGAAAAWTAWGAYRSAAGPTRLALPITAVVLVLFSFVLQSLLAPPL